VEQRAVLVERHVRQEQAAAGVAPVAPLDLDDARAEVAQAQRTGWAGEELAEIQHRHPGQRPFGSRDPAVVTLSHIQLQLIF